MLRISTWRNSTGVICVRWESEARALPSSWPQVELVQNPRRGSAGPSHRRAACSGPGGLAVQQHQRDRLSPLAISGAQCSLCLLCVCIYVFELHVHVFRCVSMYFFESIYECVHPWFYKKCQRACLLKCACVDEGPTASRAGLWFAKRLPSCPVGKRRGLIFCYRSCVLITWWPAHSVQLSPQNKEAGSAEEDLPLNLKAFVIRFTLFLLLVPVIWEFTRCALKCKSSDNFPCGRHVGTEAADDFLCQTLLQFSARFL